MGVGEKWRADFKGWIPVAACSEKFVVPISGAWPAERRHSINSTHFDRHAGGSQGSVM